MGIIVRERQYIYIRLAIEESGSYGGGNGGLDCSYDVYDPSGRLEGNLTISCKDNKLEEMLHSLRVVTSQPSVFERPQAAPAAALPSPAQATSYRTHPQTPATQITPERRATVSPVVGRRPADVAPDVSAGGLIADLAESLGVMDPFTLSMGGLIDDLLRPQK